MNIAIVATLSSEPKMTDWPSALPGLATEPAVERVLVSARKYAQPSCKHLARA